MKAHNLKYKVSYPCSFIDKEDSDREKVLVAVECHEKLHGSILIYDKEVQLQPNEAVQMNEKMFPYCCFNSSHTISFYGNNCDNLQFRYLDSICKFSNYFLEGSCDRHGIKSEAQMCTVHGLNCVLQRTFLMPCRGTKPLETCLIDKFSCL